MSDPLTLEGLRQRERELEMDAVLIRGRVLEVRGMIEDLQRRRPGRPRKIEAVATDTPNGPQGVPSALFITPTDDGEAA